MVLIRGEEGSIICHYHRQGSDFSLLPTAYRVGVPGSYKATTIPGTQRKLGITAPWFSLQITFIPILNWMGDT